MEVNKTTQQGPGNKSRIGKLLQIRTLFKKTNEPLQANRGTCLGKNFEFNYLFQVLVRGYALKSKSIEKKSFLWHCLDKNFGLATALTSITDIYRGCS